MVQQSPPMHFVQGHVRVGGIRTGQIMLSDLLAFL